MTAEIADNTELVVHDLRVSYLQSGLETLAVRGIDFALRSGDTLGIVGESGSGKSSVALGLLGLLPANAEVSGSILLDGMELVRESERKLRQVRGRRLGMVFQDPSAALNPVFSIRTHIEDTLSRHEPQLTRKEVSDRTARIIEQLGVPANRLSSYPHQLSGGMRQRALIAAAMIANPSLLVADEPTSDLDTISQQQIIGLLQQLQKQRGLGLILISHDLGVVATLCARVIVMYLGNVVEVGPTHRVFREPKHPYTQALLQISRRDRDSSGRFVSLPRRGVAQEGGCAFYDRCPVGMLKCEVQSPALIQVNDEQAARCLLHSHD